MADPYLVLHEVHSEASRAAVEEQRPHEIRLRAVHSGQHRTDEVGCLLAGQGHAPSVAHSAVDIVRLTAYRILVSVIGGGVGVGG